MKGDKQIRGISEYIRSEITNYIMILECRLLKMITIDRC